LPKITTIHFNLLKLRSKRYDIFHTAGGVVKIKVMVTWIYVVSFCIVTYTKGSHSFTCKQHHSTNLLACMPSSIPRKRHRMAPPPIVVADI